MNKNRIAKTIGFLVAGSLCFTPLIFLRSVIKHFFSSEEGLIENTKTYEMVVNICKAGFIILGVIFIAVGLYNLIMMFTEEEGN